MHEQHKPHIQGFSSHRQHLDRYFFLNNFQLGLRVDAQDGIDGIAPAGTGQTAAEQIRWTVSEQMRPY